MGNILAIAGFIVSLLRAIPQIRGLLKDIKDIFATAGKQAKAVIVARDPKTPVEIKDVQKVIAANKTNAEILSTVVKQQASKDPNLAVVGKSNMDKINAMMDGADFQRILNYGREEVKE